jgi:hypothetical protein
VTSGYREEVFNVLLALILHKRGIVTAPEKSFKKALQERRHVPDVLVTFRGLRTAIEGKVADKAAAEEKALSQARDRVNNGVAHIGIALLYPHSIRDIADFTDLQDMLAKTTFRIAVFSEVGETGWTEGGIDYLADILRRAFDQLVQEDVVNKAVETLDAGISEFSRAVFNTQPKIDQAAKTLGITEPASKKHKEPEEE